MKMQLWKASTGFIMCQKYQVAPSPLLLSDSGHSVEGSLDNRACWSPLTNTAPSKSVRSLPAEVPSLKSRYCLKLPSIFLPFLRACSQGVGHFPRGWQGRWSGGQVMCGAGHLAQDWLPRRTQGGTGRRGGALLARLLRKVAVVKLWNVITVWYGTKATQIEKCPITSLSA